MSASFCGVKHKVLFAKTVFSVGKEQLCLGKLLKICTRAMLLTIMLTGE